MDYWSEITITDIQMFHSENPIAVYNILFTCPSDFSNFCHITLQNTGKIYFLHEYAIKKLCNFEKIRTNPHFRCQKLYVYLINIILSIALLKTNKNPYPICKLRKSCEGRRKKFLTKV